MNAFFACSFGRHRARLTMGRWAVSATAVSTPTVLTSSTHTLSDGGVSSDFGFGSGVTQRRFHSSDASPDQVQRAFRTLGFSAAEAYSASQGDVKRRFLELAKSHHPDVKKQPSGSTGSTTGQTMADINDAYNLLKGFLKANPKGAASAGVGSGGYRPYGGPDAAHTGRPQGASPYGMGDDEAFWRGFDFAGGPPGSGGDFSARPSGFDRGVGGHPFFDQEDREAMMFAAMQEELARMSADLPAGARVSVEEAPDGTYTVHVEADEAPPYGRARFHGRRSEDDDDDEMDDEMDDDDCDDGFYPGDEGPAAFYAAMGGYRGRARGGRGMGMPPYAAYGPDMMRGGRGTFRGRGGGHNQFRHTGNNFRGRGRGGGGYQGNRHQGQRQNQDSGQKQSGRASRPDDYARAPLGDVERDVLRNMHNAGKSFQQIATALGKDLNVVLAGFNSMHATGKNHFTPRHGTQEGSSEGDVGGDSRRPYRGDHGSRHKGDAAQQQRGRGGNNFRGRGGGGGRGHGGRYGSHNQSANHRGRRRSDGNEDDFDVDAAMADTSEPRPFTGRPIHVRPRA